MKRLIALDFYKALAAILVILIHVTATPVVSLSEGIAVNVLIMVNRFAGPAVPMFIFASGLSLFYIYKDKVFSFTEFLGKRFSRILIPYLAWCLIYYAYFVYKDIYPLSMSFFATTVLSGKMLYHLYFVVIILQFYLLFGAYRFVVQRFSALILIPIGAVINILAIQHLPLSILSSCFLTYTTYFLLGCYTAKHLEQVIGWLKRYILVAMMFFLTAGGLYTYQFYENQILGLGYRFINDSYAYLIFCSIAIVFYFYIAMVIEKHTETVSGTSKPAFADALKTAMRKALLALSDGSFYIYLSHPLAIIAAGSISARMGLTGVLEQMIIALVVIALTSVPLSILYAKWRTNTTKKKVN